MSSRRELAHADSLEMLLDTICNVFGGIIFIAILVALLTSAQTALLRSGEDIQMVDSGSIVDELSLRAEIDDYRRALDCQVS
jgi:hypothetical protein